MNKDKFKIQSFTVDRDHHNCRLDIFLYKLLSNHTRSKIKRRILDFQVKINSNTVLKPSTKVKFENVVSVDLQTLEEDEEIKPEHIPLDIVFEDNWYAIINKDPGLIVHPGRGKRRQTLVSALLFYFKTLSNFHEDPDRPGIVHRLDKNTSGLIAIAKDDYAHAMLAKEFAERRIHKVYTAILCGFPAYDEGEINKPIGRNPNNREKMTITPTGKPSLTLYKVVEKYKNHCLVRCTIKTGRTHQIRIHFQSLGCPLLGDDLYNSKMTLKTEIDKDYSDKEELVIYRQALHATELGFLHPMTNEQMLFKLDIPSDIQSAIDFLKQNNQ